MRPTDPPSPAGASSYILRELAVPVKAADPDLAQEIAQYLRVKKSRIRSVRILRKSLDSRRRNQPVWRYTVEFDFDSPLRHPRVTPAPAAAAAAPGVPGRYRPPGRKVAVIGSGPAGMAAALGLSRKGYAVTVYEQGSDVERRFRDIRLFLKGNTFDPRSNILFGEGGAGTFSDGKLTCRTRSPYTDAFLAELVACGADESVVYLSHPHIGTDKLQFIIKAMRERAVAQGCAFRFRTLVEDILLSGGRVVGVKVEGRDEAFDAVVLAAGHSSRALYARLADLGVALESKPFAVGARVEHPQDMINRRQYGERVDVSLTGAAEYFLTWNGAIEPEAQSAASAAAPPTAGAGGPTQASAYSFCMCPGGVVVPCADAPDGLFTNGMSYSNRAGAFANSAVVVPVTPEDLSAWGLSGPLAGIDFIRSLEVKAFALGGGEFTFPAQTIKAYMEGRLDSGPFPKTSFPRPLRWADFHDLFPPKVAAALREAFGNFDRKVPGFIEHGFIIGPESRTSSPLRILRNPDTLESVSTPGLFPLGEGAGYSGGIVSSGADGLRMAEAWAPC
ncbi:MAG TPA: FAD-dependent oxidoreductase [Fibrobacteria bacterium]|nr:FAD-dependent oxidoreductase [Fibrobacteria bacterium]